MADRFLIAPLALGWQNDLKPWLIPNEAFSEMRNAYVYYGRVRKRFGSTVLNTAVAVGVQQLHSRLRADFGTTAAVTGNFSGTAPGTIFKVGQQFSIGTTIFTVSVTGTPGILLTTGTATGTFNTTSGALVITGNTENPSTSVFFYPALPVMGFVCYEDEEHNFEDTYAFDRQFAYQYISGAWARLDSGAAATWTGSDSDFFWSINYRGIAAYDGFLFTTNFTATDRIRFWDGSTWTILSGAGIQYDSIAGNEILTSRLIISFKGRLLLLNTIESLAAVNRAYPNRLRYCQVGDPVSAGQNAWREDIGGKGSFLDAPTKEAIISAQLIKDRLIVYFERSTFELVYTGNQELPFRWQSINSELGVESTFSTIVFDRSIIGVGNTGIHGCNGAYVERIDKKIPDEVFEIKNSGDGVKRVYGIRDYFAQVVYWTFPSNIGVYDFPTRVLVYNYENDTWAFNDDSITAFGYFQPPTSLTWAQATRTWQSADEIWSSGQLQAQFRHVIAGNQEGFTFICDHEFSRNAPALQISNMTVSGTGVVTITCVDHNMQASEFIVIENSLGITALNDNPYQIIGITDANTFTVNETAAILTGPYTGRGTIARLSVLDFSTKQFNFYLNKGQNVSIRAVDFFVDRTVNGEITIDTLINNSQLPIKTQILETSAYALVPFEVNQESVWHTLYPEAEGNLAQLRFYFSNTQMLDTNIVWSDVELHAILFYAQPTSTRVQ